MEKKGKQNKYILIALIGVVVFVGGYVISQKFTTRERVVEEKTPQKTIAFSRMKRDTIYFLRPGDYIKIKDETPNSTRAIAIIPPIAKTYTMEYFPDKKKWLYMIPQGTKTGDYTVRVTTTDKTTGKILKTKETRIIIDKNGFLNKEIVDTD